jgi:ABC-2 type transport system ATP-binding protein
MAQEAIVVENLTKTYPKIKAVDGISFAIPEGEIFGLLGPNGAGKTTTIRMLLTLIRPTAGSIHVFGLDALSYPDKVRQMAGYVPQDVSVDGEITAYENILIYSKLYGMPSNQRKQRIKEVLEFLGLEDRANNMVNTYSGGMMRRLELAQALVNRPRVLFLDEPSIGLDPSAKRTIWELIKRLRDEFGTTILVTTHDMVEADALCERIGIMDRGKLVVIGEPAWLKSTVGGDVLSITSKASNLLAIVKELGYSIIAESPDGIVELLVANGEATIPHLVEALRAKGAEVDSVSLKKPTLDDVFLKYTGARIGEGESWTEARRTRRTFRRLTG